jgi:hypothetical protein
MVTFVIIAVGIGFEAALCRLLLGVYAFPCFVGFLACVAAYNTGAGVVGASIVWLVVGAITLAVGQFIFGNVRSRVTRTVVALLFVIPAAMVGYAITGSFARWLEVPSVVWQQVYAIAGAIIVGAAALDRLAHPDPPDYEW